MEPITSQEKNQRVVTFLNRQEVDFLDKLGKDALFTTGVKLSRTKLIAWLIDFLKDLNLSGEGIKSESEFYQRIKELLKNFPQAIAPPATPACRNDDATNTTALRRAGTERIKQKGGTK